MTALTPCASTSVPFDPFFDDDDEFPFIELDDAGLAEQATSLLPDDFLLENDLTTERKRPIAEISTIPQKPIIDTSAEMIPHLFATYLALGSYVPEEKPFCLSQFTWERLLRAKQEGGIVKIVSLSPYKFIVRQDLDFIYFTLATQGYQRMLYLEINDKLEKKWNEWWGKAKVLTPITSEKIFAPDTSEIYILRTITPPLKLVEHPYYIQDTYMKKIEYQYYLIERILKRMLSDESRANLIRAGVMMRKLSVIQTYPKALTHSLRELFSANI